MNIPKPRRNDRDLFQVRPEAGNNNIPCYRDLLRADSGLRLCVVNLNHMGLRRR